MCTVFGKTTLARLIAKDSNAHFETLSAVTSGIKDIKPVIETAKERRNFQNQKTILFVDEIHRFNKAQQDAFLPHVEDGLITLIGATTENPSFEVIGALLSRCQVFVLNPLDQEALVKIINRVLTHKRKTEFLDETSQAFLLETCHGDARYLINLIEALLNAHHDEKQISLEQVQTITQKKSLAYDKNGEHHYNLISAFIKSMRGSNPDGAVYYLARMIESGEDPLFIARRMVIFASEDIGLANPQAVQVAVACQQSYRLVGAAEGWIPLSHCAVYLAGSPKSNSSYMAYKNALKDVKEFGDLAVPLHLRNAPTKLMKNLGYGKDYQYAHNFENAKDEQNYLPDKLKDKKYYEPKEIGHEKKLKDWLNR